MTNKNYLWVNLAFVFLAILLIPSKAQAQSWAIKTNALYWATLSPNIDAEARVADKWSVELSLGYNPWTFSDNRKIKHIAIQPEARYWFCSTFSGHFLAANVFYAHYNLGGLRNSMIHTFRDNRYQGDALGAGIGYGYNLILSPRWSLEFETTLGVIITKYSKCKSPRCGDWIKDDKKTFFSPTRIAVDVVYYLK